MLSQHFLPSLLLILSSAMSKSVNADDKFCSRDHVEEVFLKDKFHYLNVGRLGTYTVHDIFDCTFKCLSNPSCQSLNLAASKQADGKLWCDLLSSTKYSNPEVYKENASSHHFFIKIPCLSTPCQNGGTCVRSGRNYSYECRCKEDFVGKHCERKSSTVAKSPGSSCKDIYHRNLQKENKAYELNLGSQRISVYCHMNDTGLGACGGGGWTLVIKIDGTKTNFRYDSNLWNNNETFNLSAGATGFDTQETKLPTYWNTSFSKICLGMKVGQQINFIVIHKQASSLFSLIADGQYRNTSLGRNTWKTLIGSEASLQRNCNKEGFNAFSDHSGNSKARIGILGNDENDCDTGDSRIGFGCGGYPFTSNTCGNAAQHSADNGNKDFTTMGYILVQ